MENEILMLIEGKERRAYAKEHGVESLINMFHGLPWNDSESERVYAICNKKKITWQEYYKIKEKKSILF